MSTKANQNFNDCRIWIVTFIETNYNLLWMTFGLLNTHSLPTSVGSNILTTDENLLECINLTKPHSPPIKGLKNAIR